MKSTVIVFRNLARVLAGMTLARAATFLTAILLARHLGPDGFGEFGLFYTVMLLVWQIPGALDYSYVRYAASEASRSEMKDYLRVTFCLKLIFCTVSLAAAYPLGSLFADWILAKPEASNLVAAGIAAGGLLSLVSSVAGVYQAVERFGVFSALNALFAILTLCAIGVALIAGVLLSSHEAVAIHVAAAAVAGGAAFLWLHGRTKPLFPVKTEVLSGMLRFGGWLFAGFLAFVLFQRIDVLVLARLVPFDELGLYNSAVRIAILGTVLTTGAGHVLMPRASCMLIGSYFRTALKVSGVLSVLILILLLSAPTLVAVLFGREYTDAGGAARVLVVGVLLTAIYGPLSFAFYGLDRPRSVFFMNLSLLLIGGAAVLMLSPRMGIIGAALGMTAGHLAALIYVASASVLMLRNSARSRT